MKVVTFILSRRALAIVLLVGCLTGLLDVSLMPPWQHYDEPGHFEYAWLIANRGRLPHAGDYDEGMRVQVAASMIERAFYRGLGAPPSLLSQGSPIDIGLSQLRHPPLYYILASLPLFALRYTDVTLQLYAARLISVGLFLVTIVAAWGLVGELVSPASPLRWMIPAFLALLPGFIDLMTAVNNDVGAVAIFSLFLWGAVRLIQRGVSLGRLVWVLGAAWLCYWTKDTVFIALALLPVALLLGFFRGKWRPAAWGLLGAAVLVGLIAMFSWDGAAPWYQRTNQDAPARVAGRPAPLGQHVFEIKTDANHPADIEQFIPPTQVEGLGGKLVTLGAWIWSSKPVRTNTPILNIDKGSSTYSANVDVGTTPVYYAFSVAIPEGSSQTWVALAPQVRAEDEGVDVFYDGVVLAEGERPQHEAPQFGDDYGQRGVWGGRAFENLVRNASAEAGGPTVRAWVDKAAARYSMIAPSMVLASLLDWQGTHWYWQVATESIFQTFWAKLGWGHIPLFPYGDTAYSILAIVTLVGVVGAGIALWDKRRGLPWSSLLFLGLVLGGVWAITLMRGVSSLWSATFIPVARYGFPAMIPTALVLNAGWWEVSRLIPGKSRLFSRMPYLIYAAFFVALDGLAVASILHYYGS